MNRAELDLVYGGYESDEHTDVCGVSSEERDVVQFAIDGDEEALADCNLPQLEEARDALELCRNEGCDNHFGDADDALRAIERAIRNEHARIEQLDEDEREGPPCCGGRNCVQCVGGGPEGGNF